MPCEERLRGELKNSGLLGRRARREGRGEDALCLPGCLNGLLEAERGDEGGEQEMEETTSMGWGGQTGVGGTRRSEMGVGGDMNVRDGDTARFCWK